MNKYRVEKTGILQAYRVGFNPQSAELDEFEASYYMKEGDDFRFFNEQDEEIKSIVFKTPYEKFYINIFENNLKIK